MTNDENPYEDTETCFNTYKHGGKLKAPYVHHFYIFAKRSAKPEHIGVYITIHEKKNKYKNKQNVQYKKGFN